MQQDKRLRFEEKSTEHLRDEGIFWQTEAALLKRSIASALAKQMERQDLTSAELARRLNTSRAALARILDPANTSITLTTLARTAAMLGCHVRVEIVVQR